MNKNTHIEQFRLYIKINKFVFLTFFNLFFYLSDTQKYKNIENKLELVLKKKIFEFNGKKLIL